MRWWKALPDRGSFRTVLRILWSLWTAKALATRLLGLGRFVHRVRRRLRVVAMTRLRLNGSALRMLGRLIRFR